MPEPLFPTSVSVVVQLLMPDTGPTPEIIGAELDAIARATPARAREFAWGRWCARQALAPFGQANIAIPAGAHREPIWPDGIVGSITHCTDMAAAAVSSATHFQGLGIDVEPLRTLHTDDQAVVLTDSERATITMNTYATEPATAEPVTALTPDSSTSKALALFSAKESVFKAAYPICGIYFDFLDAEILPEWEAGSFTVRAMPGTPAGAARLLPYISGRIQVLTHHVMTSAILHHG